MAAYMVGKLEAADCFSWLPNWLFRCHGTQHACSRPLPCWPEAGSA